MFINKIRSFLTVFILLMLVSSCISRKKYAYFQDKKSNTEANDTAVTVSFYEHKIRTDDILSVFVASLSPEASSYFNAPLEKGSVFEQTDIPKLTGYQVDVYGNIELPMIGKTHVGGLTLSQARDTLRDKLDNYLINPSVRVSVENFKFTVLGEVSVPGNYAIIKEKITIPEALAMAGDMTVYGIRSNVLIVRENENGTKEYGTIDITSREVFKSKYYYLHPNDILYVSARKTKITSGDLFFKVAPITISLITFLSLLLSRYGQ